MNNKKYSTFNKHLVNALKEPMFFGENVNVSRYDQQKYPFFEKLIEKQLSFFWRPEEVELNRDRKDFVDSMAEHERHIFLSNLKYQTLLDSVQGRSPNVAFLPLVSIPELETWIETWSFSETIHSRSYTHIIRNIVSDPSEIFDDIVDNLEIQKRAESVTQYYDKLISLTNHMNDDCIDLDTNHEFRREIKKQLYLTMVSVNVLEAIRFYVSFACSFSFAERKLMEGNAKIIKLIARDEALHLSGTQNIINILDGGSDDPEFKEISEECSDEVYNIFRQAAEQEKEWAKYLFKDGSVIGLNERILCDYVEYITDVRLRAIKKEPIYGTKNNPLPWMNHWLTNDNVQVAPQETEITSYQVGQFESDIGEDFLSDVEL